MLLEIKQIYLINGRYPQKKVKNLPGKIILLIKRLALNQEPILNKLFIKFHRKYIKIL